MRFSYSALILFWFSIVDRVEGLSILNRQQLLSKIFKTGCLTTVAWANDNTILAIPSSSKNVAHAAELEETGTTTTTTATIIKQIPSQEATTTTTTTIKQTPSQETTTTTATTTIKQVSPQEINGKADNNNFKSAGFDRKEYNQSIVASRDTNISPKEVYDTILRLKKKNTNSKASSSSNIEDGTTVPNDKLRALDVGAGAGVSTQVLWEMGYTEIDALDWSGTAWKKNVEEEGNCPPSVKFYELDDERYLQQWRKANNPNKKYDVIAFNFAVNVDKALLYCKELLKEDGLLLAPINVQTDYWLRQAYFLLDANGKVLWSTNDIGAWSVQFQPDVTAETCQGIWCSPFNGFKKLKQ